MRVSVIIPTYNRADLLSSSLVSVLEQTHRPWQVIVVDDGSSDQSHNVAAHLLSEYKYEWPYGRVIRQEKNQGKSVAVNRGLKDADGNLIWIWDDDDLADPERLERMVPMFEEDEQLGLVHTWAEWMEPIEGGAQTAQVIEWMPEDTPIKDVLRANLRGNIFFTISCLWRGEVLDTLAELEGRGVYDMREGAIAVVDGAWPLDPDLERAQDFDFWMRMSYAMVMGEWTCKLLKEKTVTARQHRGRRGKGHRFPFEDVPKETMKCERLIFQKLARKIPIPAIFPGYNEREVLRQEAHVELAYAFAIRGLWDYVYTNLQLVVRPQLLVQRIHRGLVDTLWGAVRSVNGSREVLKELHRIKQGIPSEMSASDAANIII